MCNRNSPVLAQRGFSLIELMVGLTIGLLVVLAAIGSLVFTQATSTVVDDGARLQQKADMVFRNLGYHVSQAGAIELLAVSADPAMVAFSTTYNGFNNTSFSIHGLASPITLQVSYQANANSHDCLGNSPSGANVDNAFYVTGTDLMCLGASNAPAQSIADGVEDFQVLYGVQTLVAGVQKYQFYDASTVLDWSNIQAVQVCLQLVGDSKGLPQPASLVMKGCQNQTLTNDGYLHRVYKRTFSIRNALP
ncbi:hypothetical protein GALL_270120 [mine drainage metagenome]|uniref:Type IV pilus assembly protein PilW n=1 Tax=mine drainage metagenome TaxID=410659 RepID=A0A1J5RG70_9ZZZZ